jgi:acetyl-CoA carboxylase alpha subunit
MTNSDDDLAAKIADLDARLSEVEALQALTLRILSTTRPLDAVLAQYGASEAQQQALYRLLDNLAARTRGSERERPTHSYFQMQFAEIFPLQGDRAFMDLVVDTLRIEQPLYRDLYVYMTAQGWVK